MKNFVGSFEEYSRRLRYFANKLLDQRFAQYCGEAGQVGQEREITLVISGVEK